jgi:hypothetical protein
MLATSVACINEEQKVFVAEAHAQSGKEIKK